MKAIEVKIYEGGFVECLNSNCSFNRDCTNHTSAGEYRSECGSMPALTVDPERLAAARSPTTITWLMCHTYRDDIDPLDVTESMQPSVGFAVVFDEVGVGIVGDRLVCQPDRASRCFQKAEEWYAHPSTSGRYGSAKSVAVSAVAEYIANQIGYTLYK